MSENQENVVDIKTGQTIIPQDLREELAKKSSNETVDELEKVFCHWLVSKCVNWAANLGDKVAKRIVEKVGK